MDAALADDLLALIAAALPLDARCRCLRLCKSWRKIEDHPDAWAECNFPAAASRGIVGRLDDAAFTRVVRRAGPSLRTLACHSSWITDNAVRELVLCSSLKVVDLSGCTRVTMEGLLTLPTSLEYLDVRRMDDIELRPLRARFAQLEELEHSHAWCDFHTCVDARGVAPFDEQINEWYKPCRPCEDCESLYCESCIEFFKEDAYCPRCGEWRCPDCAEEWTDTFFECEGIGCRTGAHMWSTFPSLCGGCKVDDEVIQASKYVDDEDARDLVGNMCPECFGMYEWHMNEAYG